MSQTSTLTCLVICSLLSLHISIQRAIGQNFEQIYQKGLTAYNKEKWTNCQMHIKDAIKLYNFYVTSSIDCFRHCEESDAKIDFDNIKSNEDLRSMFHYNSITVNICFEKCKQRYAIDYEVSYLAFLEFGDSKPYDFLQFCAYKNKDYEEAASSIYTYYLRHQTCNVTLTNLEFYKTLPGISIDDFIDLELKPHQKHYGIGVQAYNDEDWANVMTEMTLAARLFLREEARCRIFCGIIQENNTFVESVSGRHIELIKCQYGCEAKLGVMRGMNISYYYASHFHYMQYSNYKLNKLEQAMSDIATYLLFTPYDNVMMANKLHYINSGYGQEHFVPYKEAVQYFETRQKLAELWKIIEKGNKLNANDTDQSQSSSDGKSTNHVPSPEMTQFMHFGMKVVQSGTTTDGKDWFVVDGFLRIEQCEALIELIQTASSQHLEGIDQASLPDVLKYIEIHPDDEISLRVLMSFTQLIKFYTETYLKSQPMYISDMRLDCSSQSGTTVPECVQEKDDQCLRDIKQKHNNYTVILHLDKEGGAMAVSFGDEDKIIKPSCGIVVALPSSSTYKRQSHGTRQCTITYSYTTNANFTMSSIKTASDKVQNRPPSHPERMRMAKQSQIIADIEKSGVKVSVEDNYRNETRFEVDGVMDEAVCERMMAITLTASLLGDGYTDDRFIDKTAPNTPHTKHEYFEGVTVRRVYELVLSGEMSPDALETYLNISEISRDMTAKYFNLKTPLYFDFTHLVCREAVDGENVDRNDLSHPVHADNCVLMNDGTCPKLSTAYVQRDYSAILYLNNDFIGGEFFFANNDKSVQRPVTPKCGHLVSFKSDVYHGVKAVIRGRRCAVAMWYTLDPNFEELPRLHARRLIEKIRSGRVDITPKYGATGRGDSGKPILGGEDDFEYDIKSKSVDDVHSEISADSKNVVSKNDHIIGDSINDDNFGSSDISKNSDNYVQNYDSENGDTVNPGGNLESSVISENFYNSKNVDNSEEHSEKSASDFNNNGYKVHNNLGKNAYKHEIGVESRIMTESLSTDDTLAENDNMAETVKLAENDNLADFGDTSPVDEKEEL